ncbi:hypothetical protein R1flu_024027 [Riccia fluitans]|uniref:Uncharacterized protein n=1 Tax=Riccia fluitans TaxID=41844 RepID=A0ABD1XTQ0_9MARC
MWGGPWKMIDHLHGAAELCNLGFICSTFHFVSIGRFSIVSESETQDHLLQDGEVSFGRLLQRTGDTKCLIFCHKDLEASESLRFWYFEEEVATAEEGSGTLGVLSRARDG